MTHLKMPLSVDPFIKYFEYGNSINKSGYWTYEHMVCQLEDVLDVLHVLFNDDFDFLFLFDHSCGHDRSRPNGLNVTNMNISYGGKQNSLHDSEIKNHDGFLGEYHYPDHDCPQLQIGDIQSFNFQSTDKGPFWMSAQEREITKYDKKQVK